MSAQHNPPVVRGTVRAGGALVGPDRSLQGSILEGDPLRDGAQECLSRLGKKSTPIHPTPGEQRSAVAEANTLFGVLVGLHKHGTALQHHLVLLGNSLLGSGLSREQHGAVAP